MHSLPTAGCWILVFPVFCCVLVSVERLHGQTARPPAASEIRILAAEGLVEISPAGAATWVRTQGGQDLHPGDRLHTGPNSRVKLRWSDESVVPFGALTELQILPPHIPNAQSGLNLIQGILSFFHRDKPGRIRVMTRGSVAGVEGTEFVVEVAMVNGADRTTFSLIDGKVSLTTELGSMILTNGEQAVIIPGQTPKLAPGFIVNNVLQWCFYYPAVLDLRELPLIAAEELILTNSMAAYQAGDLQAALALYPPTRQPGSDAERIYHAALLLSVGQVGQAQEILSVASRGDPSARLQRLATALRQLIAAVKHEGNPSTLDPRLATEFLAASYYEQSRALGENSLKTALQLARSAVTNAPDFGFAWARVAELEFSFGRTDRATDALNRSLTLAPLNAEALALKGFLLAAKNQTRQAIDWFDRAINADSALGNAWLGRGLCRIRRGDTKGGREDLLMAAAVEPQRALLRSYLGKAYANAGDGERAVHELAVARRLDPNDPTAWLYSALLNEQGNRLNAAVIDLERSLALNENRRLYRSELLLDQDRAVRSTSLASIYQQVGMTEVALREAGRAVTYDYANYSAHLFLANSYDALRDPTRFNLRYETPWFNELLLANLLAPAGVGALAPNISQQEYLRLFERDRLGLTTTTELRSDGQYREVASQFGSYGPLSYSLDLDWQRNEGVRPNNELTRTEWYSQIKYQLTPKDSVLILTKYQDYHSGDNFQYFDPNAVTVTTSPGGGTKTNTAYRPFFTFDEIQDPTILAAYHREWSPGIHTLAMGGRLINDQHISDKGVTLPVFNRNPSGQLSSVVSSDFDVNYRSQFEIWTAELNQIFRAARNTMILGGRFQTGEFVTDNQLTNVTVFNAFFPPVDQGFRQNFQRGSLYAYDTFELLLNQLWITAGLSYDRLEYPENFRQVPISNTDSTAHRLGPKAALVWSPVPAVTVRGAYARSLGGVSFDQSYRLEPLQLAGFNQSFRSVIPESVVGSVSAPRIETAGVALDLKFKTQTYAGVVAEILRSDVDRSLGVYRFPNAGGVGFASSTPERLEYEERSVGFTINQLLSEEWSAGASYTFTRSELNQILPEVPVSILSDAARFSQADLHSFRVFLLYHHPCGFFAQADANWYLQENMMSTNSAAGRAVEVPLPGDDFWHFNFWLGYRFRRGRGDISVGLLNATGTDYRLNPLSLYTELPRERVVAARLRFRF